MAPDNQNPTFDPTAPYYSAQPTEKEQPTKPTFDPNQSYDTAPPKPAPSGAWENFKSRMFEPVKMEEIEQIPGLQPDVVEELKERGQAAWQPTLRKIFGTEQGDAIREHIMLGFSPEVFARAAGKTLTDWYSPAMLAMSIPGRIAHGYQAAAQAAEHAGLLDRAGKLANKARLAGAIGTASGVPFVAKQVNGLMDNWDRMSPEERFAGVLGVIGGSVLGGTGAHEALAGRKMQARIKAEAQKYAEPEATSEYPVRVYNGTGADVASIEDLDAKYSLPRATGGPGVYLSRDPQVASEYVKNTPGARVLGGVMKNTATLLNAQQELPETILKERNLPTGTSYLDALNYIRQEAGGLDDAVPEIKSLQRELAREGYHGIDNLYGNRDVLMLFGNEVLPEGERYKDLIKSGVPSKGGNFVAESAQRYNASHGNPEINHEAPPVDHDRATRLSEEMDTHVHEPENPRVKDAYNSLIQDVKSQWDHAIKDLHIKMEPSEEDPYKSYQQVKEDILNNRRLKIFTGGNPLPPDHPLSAVDSQTGLTYNTMLRGVHDLFGHVAGDNDFSEQGESGATDAHRQMMSTPSVPALLNETEGQVSQFFHGKGKGNFPEQKATIVPNEFLGRSISAVANKEMGEEHPYITAMKEKFGSSSNPKKILEAASFITPDGEIIRLSGKTHDEAINQVLNPKEAAEYPYRLPKEDARIKFVNDTGLIRVRFSHDHGGDTLHISVPRDGVTDDQLSMLRQAVAQNKYGNFVLERSDITPETQSRRGRVVEFAKPLDLSNAMREIGAHPEQKPHKSWIDNTLKEMDEHTAGAFDPNTGKEDKTGVGVEVFPEARADREVVQHKPTKEELQDFYTEHKDLFEKHPELRVGWDKTDKGWELNIGASGTREGAIKVGNKLDQRAVWDIDNKEEIPLQGKGQQQEFRDYPLADRLRDLKGGVVEPESQKAVEHPQLNRPRGSSTDLLENPIPKTSEELSLFADKVHRGMSISGTAISDFQKTMGRWVRDVAGEITKPSAILKRSIKIAENEINHWMMENGGEGLGWYKKMTAGAIDALKEAHPDLDDPTRQTIFKALWAAHSYGTKPGENIEQAERNLTNYEKTGKIAYDQGYTDPKTGETRKWSGHSGNVYTMAKTQHLIDSLGEDGAARWLTEKHTWPEIKAEFDKAGLNTSKSGIPFFEDGTTYGAMAFGPKGGAFFLNLNGIHDFTTTDIWGSRALRRWEGRLGQEDTLSTDPKTGIVSDEPPEPDEIERYHKVIDTIGKKMGLDNGDVQALQWYYEHKLYEVHGVGEEARDYEKAAKEVAARRERGEQGGAKTNEINALDFLGIKSGIRSGENAEEGGETEGRGKNADTGELFARSQKRVGREPGEEGPEEVIKPEQQKKFTIRKPSADLPEPKEELGPLPEEGRNALWERWTTAQPFTAHQDGFVNIGDTHEAAFAEHKFNGKVPEDFEGWEQLARDYGDDYHARGWAAKNGSRMFLWDNLRDMLQDKTNLKWDGFKNALVALEKKGMAKSTTKLWDNGGDSYLGTLEDLGLLKLKQEGIKPEQQKGIAKYRGMQIEKEGKEFKAMSKGQEVARADNVADLQKAIDRVKYGTYAAKPPEAVKIASDVVEPEQQKELLNRLPKNQHYPGTVLDDIYHELGHAIVGEHVGIPSADGVRTDRHPATTGVASMVHDFSNLGADESGDLPYEKARNLIDKLIIAGMGGGAAEEVLSGVPMDENDGMQGDLNKSHEILQALGYTSDEAWDKIDAAKIAAKNILTRPGISDIIKKYAAEREEGLPNTHHMSQARVDELVKEINERTKEQNQEGREAGGNNGGRTGVAEGVRGEVDTGAKGGGPSGTRQEAAQLKLPGFQKKTQDKEADISRVPVGAGFLAGGGPKNFAAPSSKKKDLSPGAAALAGKPPVDIPSKLDEVADEFGIPKDILRAQARKESNLNPNAISMKGAKGVMQLMDRTAHDLGVKDPFDPEQNIRGGAKYLSDLHRRLGYWDRALAAYNWGPDRVKDVIDLYGPAWLEHTPKETQDYVHKILKK